MVAYTTVNELETTMVDLWQSISRDPAMSLNLLKSQLSVQFNYRDPAGKITVDCSDGQEMKISAGESQVKPLVEMSMKADVAHEFWLGKVNVPVAILTGRIVAKGPVSKALALLPVLRPAYKLYPDIYKRNTQNTSVAG